MNKINRPLLSFPGKLHRRGAALLNQQCWLWGQDVKREQGNLLIEFGFTRMRPPDGRSGASQYSMEVSRGVRVRLWAFGIYFGGDSGVYLNRFELAPRLATWTDAWHASEMAGLKRSHDWHLALDAIRWIAAYEAWVLARFGAAYRGRCLAPLRNPVAAPEHIASMWCQLADEWQAVLTALDRFHSRRKIACPSPSSEMNSLPGVAV